MADDHQLRVAAWNLERKKPTSPRGAEAIEYLHGVRADVMSIVETRTTFPTRGGHMLFSAPPIGKRFADDERKVALWSSTPLERVELVSNIDPTRLVAARTTTALGEVLVLAICITWHMAEVTYHHGPKKKPWEEHLQYLEDLDKILASIDEPTIIAGDFNQRIPRVRGNASAAEALDRTFDGFDIVTAGTLRGCTKPGIDHIAINEQLAATNVEGWPNNVTGNRLSDHDGALADVMRCP